MNHRSSFGPPRRAKLPSRNPSYSPYDVEDDREFSRENDGFEEEDDVEMNGAYDVDDDNEEDDEDYGGNGDSRVSKSRSSQRYRKKRRLENLGGGGGGGYRFGPRMAAKGAGGLSNSVAAAEWTERATLVLLDVWGDKFLQLGRKSLRSDDWHEVAERVSEELKVETTDLQCRNRLDTLKKRYKKEKEKVEKFGANACKWPYFKKMDALMDSSPRQQHGLACGVDSGEYVFMNPKVYLSRSNGFDEMRDSPGNSEESDDGDHEYDSDGFPPRMTKFGGEDGGDSSFSLLADSIEKFGEIYERMESCKREQMMELERMKMDFHRDLELQKKQMLEKAQAEIAKLQQGDDEDTDVSTENLSE